MLARLLRLALVMECALWAGLACVLVQRPGGSLMAAGGVILALALGARLAIVLLVYALAAAFDGPALEGRPGAWRCVLEILREWLAFTAAFTLLQPFPGLWMGEDRVVPGSDRAPLILVHGFRCNRAFWWWLRSRLERAGWTVATVSLEPLTSGIDQLAGSLAERIETVCRQADAQKVIVIGHSMGGLVARACLRLPEGPRIARLITLGTPHAGSAVARFGIGRNARQMEPGSAWLEALNRDRRAGLASDMPILSFFSAFDGFVSPRQSVLLGEGRDRSLGGVGHLSMAFSPRVAKAVLSALGEANSQVATEPQRNIRDV